MNRATVILLCLGLFGLVSFSVITDPQSGLFGSDITVMWIHGGLTCVTVWSLIGYCGFAALHSTQHLTCPHERSYWLIAVIGGNIVGSCIYFCTRYQKFRAAGAGRLLSRKRVKPVE